MIKKSLILATIALSLLLSVGATAQKPKPAPAYKVSAITITPFNEAIGKFETPLSDKDQRSFFNDLSLSLFVSVEILGEVGSFEPGRKLQVTVMEGKKVKYSKVTQVGLIGEEGKYYMPVWLNSAMCDTVTITAKLVGQKTASSVKRSVPFMCGE